MIRPVITITKEEILEQCEQLEAERRADDCELCDGTGYTCKGACFGKPTCDGKPCPNGCTPEGLFTRGVRALRDEATHTLDPK